ncbi:MAG: peptidyl-prolyl cis-trans isomerase [Candidatus Omnitrophica bacterium]|nr:peptidyl-prolyl cis-trans isomerase [Candidatus Omnitrophota bacterium]
MSISIDKRAAAIVITLMLFAAGCEKGLGKEKQILAKINNYEMTVSDFQDEARLTRSNKSLSPDEAKAKAQLLEALINKKILIQEALKLNFDKDKTFMKEIERYWEQALLKLLFKIKSDELSRTVRVDDFEVRQAFVKMRKKIFAQFVVLSDKSAAQQLSQAAANFDKLKTSFKGFITQETTEWWGWRDLPGGIEDILFGLKPGEISRAFQYSDNWAVVRVLKEEDVQTGPIEKMAPYIRGELLKQKKTEALENWIDSVTKKAKVKINQKLLEQIKIE